MTLDPQRPPHIFQTAALCYKHICEIGNARAGDPSDAEDPPPIHETTMHFVGVSGSGKSTSAQRVLDFFSKAATTDDVSALKIRALQNVLHPLFSCSRK